MKKAHVLRKLSRTGTYVIAILLAIWVLFPIYLIAVMTFSTQAGVYIFPKPLFPQPISTETLQFFVNSTGVLKSTLNSVYVAIISMVLAIIVGAPAGYALARFIFPGRDLYRLAVVSTRSFPTVILSVPLAVTFINWGMYDSIISLALVHTAINLPFTVLITSSVFAGVPKEQEEAAQTLGCNGVSAVIKVTMPQALPGIAAATLFNFVGSWNEVFASVILTVRNRTLPALVMASLSVSPLPYRFAGAFFILLPSLVFMLFIRKYLLNLWGKVVK
ncbi:MAG: carbohydrate ABC transporter permease [Chloroflexi bacterium]|nr:carbohydrate ABC transporter permease [Chloroflexota bacterium]